MNICTYIYIYSMSIQYICIWRCTCSWKTAMPICNVRLQYCKHWRNLKCIVIESRPNFADLDHRTRLSNPTPTTPHMSGLYWKFWGFQHFSSPSFHQCIAVSSVRRFLGQTHKNMPKKHLGQFLYDNSGWQIEFGSIDPQAVSLFFSPAFERAYQYFWRHITKIANIGNTLQKTKL